MSQQAILFTNIDGISIGDIAIEQAHALLLTDGRARAFLYNSVTPACSLVIDSLDYDVDYIEIAGIPTMSMRMTLDAGRGGKHVLKLNLSRDAALGIDRFGGASLDMSEVFAVLNRRIVAYWKAPYFLESHQVSIHEARSRVGIQRP